MKVLHTLRIQAILKEECRLAKQLSCAEKEQVRGSFTFLTNEKIDLVMESIIRAMVLFLTVVGIPYTIYLLWRFLLSF